MLYAQKPVKSSDLRTRRAVFWSVAALMAAGFVLRLFAARGDLWLDEIWSIQNLQHIRNVGDIFWGISDDNNHLLNSLWLWIVGPDAPPIVIRLEAIVLGTCTIPVAAMLCVRSGAVAALAGASIVAFSDLFVHYGSEARGYAGLILMIFIAAEALERFLENPDDHRSRLAFGVAVALGALFHLTMLLAVFTLLVATLGRVWLRGRSLRRVGFTAIDLGIPAVLGAVPALGFLLAGVLNMHKIQLGVQVPFTVARLARGLTTVFTAIFGLPYGLPIWLGAGIAVVLTVLVICFLAPERRILPLACLLLPPAIAGLLQLPSVHIARFHLVASLGLVLLFAETMAKLWSLRHTHLVLAIGFLIAVGNARNVAQLLALGRGDYETVVARMESAGPATYGSNMPAEVGRTVRFYDRKFGSRLAPVSDWCRRPADWFVLSDDPGGEAKWRAFGPQHCAASFALDLVKRPAPLSGLRLALYRRTD
jgi:hypothetical protein